MSLLRSPKSSKQELPTQSLLIPPNPQIVDPGSSPSARGGILLNPIGGDGDSGEHTRRASDAGSSYKAPKRLSISSGSPGFQGGSRPVRTKSTLSNSASASSSGYSSSEGSTAPTTASAPRTASQSPKLKFAPLPQSGRQRSSSITLGVAARAAMLSGTGYGPAPNGARQQASPQAPSGPHWQQNVAPMKPMWYNGGPMPDNVKTVKDIKPGLKKAWGKIRRSSSTSKDGRRSDSADSTASASTSGSSTTADMSAADEAVSLSDSSSMISDSSSTISEEDESEIAEEERLQAEALRGRPTGRTSPVHMHHTQMLYGHPISASPEHAGLGSGDVTPRRRHSPPAHAHHSTHLAHVYSNEGGTTSGASTPRRRMSLSDMHADAAGDTARHGRHHQAVFGFDEKMLNSKFDSLALSKQDSIATTESRESENMEDEEDVPIPDSRQISGAAKEVAI